MSKRSHWDAVIHKPRFTLSVSVFLQSVLCRRSVKLMYFAVASWLNWVLISFVKMQLVDWVLKVRVCLQVYISLKLLKGVVSLSICFITFKISSVLYAHLNLSLSTSFCEIKEVMILGLKLRFVQLCTTGIRAFCDLSTIKVYVSKYSGTTYLSWGFWTHISAENACHLQKKAYTSNTRCIKHNTCPLSVTGAIFPDRVGVSQNCLSNLLVLTDPNQFFKYLGEDLMSEIF